jgi:hypothetical protein
MRRPIRGDTNTAGQDSFLDVVTNIVGILIILVIIAGLRIKNAPVKEAEDEAVRNAKVALQTDLAIEGSLRADVVKAAEQMRRLQEETVRRSRERDLLATAVAALEADLKNAREQLDTESQESFDLQRRLAEGQQELTEVEQSLIAAETAQAEPVLVKNYPTPIGKTVDENEVHFQLRGGRIAFIPMDRLRERLEDDFRQKAYRLLSQRELTETVGPEGGFRLRYTFVLRESPQGIPNQPYPQFKRATFIPVSSELGETLEEALAAGSQFRSVLSQHRPDRATITLWTYEDSFAEFRQLKKELFELGFATAGRPLLADTPIGISPEGTKSAAE